MVGSRFSFLFSYSSFDQSGHFICHHCIYQEGPYSHIIEGMLNNIGIIWFKYCNNSINIILSNIIIKKNIIVFHIILLYEVYKL